MSQTALLARPLRERLPQLDPEQARARNKLLALFSSMSVQDGNEPLLVSAAPADPDDAPALAFAAPGGRLSLRAERVDGVTPAPLESAAALPAALPAALAELARAEPLLAALEAATGSSFDPVGVERAPAAEAVALRIELRRTDGRTAHVFLVALAPALVETWPQPPLSPRSLGAAGPAATACGLRVDGPVLERATLAALRFGDLLLLPRADADGWPATIVPPAGDRAVRGRLDPARARFTALSSETLLMLGADDLAPAAVEGGGGGELGPAVDRLPVEVTVAIGPVRTTVAELATLQAGSVLLLPDLGDSPEVTVLAGDRPVAHGKLMAVGEAYGVLIERVTE